MASRWIDVDAVTHTGFGLAEDVPIGSGAWHAHEMHQLLYASSGSLVLTVAKKRWLLPPQRAAWISAQTRHLVSSKTGASLRTVYLSRSLVCTPDVDCRVFAVTPIAREMILFAMRWRADDEHADRTRRAYFEALAGLAREFMAGIEPFYLPTPESAELARAMRFVDEHLDDATVENTAKAAGTSVRTLSRRFDAEARMSFRDYLQYARMLRAMELLARPNASVTKTAYDVGFTSLGAFTTAFRERCGETPSEFRARVGRSETPVPSARRRRKA